MSALRRREGLAPQALAFLILTAARSEEVRGATWDEIDLENNLWTIPATRMKKEREHVVPLSTHAQQLLRSLYRDVNHPLVFPSHQTRGIKMSDMTLSAVIRRMHESEKNAGRKGWVDPKEQDADGNSRTAVPHGFRSSFRDWAGETTDFPRETIEHALAHGLPNKAEAAYARGTHLEKRRHLMQAWGDYCMGGNTIP